MKERINMKAYDFRGHLDGCNTHVAHLAPSFDNECTCGYAQFKQSLDMGFMLEMTGEEQTAALVRWREAVLGRRELPDPLAHDPAPTEEDVVVYLSQSAVGVKRGPSPAGVDATPGAKSTSPGLESDGDTSAAMWASGYAAGHDAGYKKGQQELVERIDNWFKGR